MYSFDEPASTVATPDLAATMRFDAVSARVFVRNLEVLSEAKGGPAQLKRLILELSVRGLLVPQSEHDGNGKSTIAGARQHEASLVAQGRLRRRPPHAPVGRDEQPFAIPASWAWVRFGELGDWGAGATPTRGNAEYYGGTMPWFKSGELNDGYVHDSEEHVTELAMRECSLRLNNPGDVLIAMYGATIGKVALARAKCTTNQAVCACTCFEGIDNEFLLRVLKAFKHRFVDQGAGGAQPNISRVKIVETPCPLPPLAEQKRIVTRVDQLMALIDDLEAKQTKKRDLSTRFTRASLEALTTAESPEDFDTAWKRVVENFPTVVGSVEKVEDLRARIVELAFRGKLSHRVAADGPIDDLLERIDGESLRDNAGESEFDVPSKEAPFEIPKTWRWTRYGRLMLGTSSGWSPQCEGRPRVGGEWGVLKVSAVSWGRFDPEANKALPVGIPPRAEFQVQDGDFLMSRANTAELVGRSVVVSGAPKRLILSDKIIRCSISKFVEKEYVNLYNRTSVARAHYIVGASGTSDSMKNISRNVILSVPIPLPPQAEQARIVAKVQHLMKLCDDLEAKLSRAEDRASKFVEAVVHELVA